MTIFLLLMGDTYAAPVPEAYDFYDLLGEPHPLFVTGAPGLAVLQIYMQNRVAIIRPPTLAYDKINAQYERAQDLGPVLGSRVTDVTSTNAGGVVTVDFFTREVLLEGDYGDVVPDIDGNGLPDIHGRILGVHLQLEDGWRTVPYPTPAKPTESSYTRWIPVGDLDGDGCADLLYAEDTDWTILYGLIPAAQSGHLELFRGSPDGYEPTPAWTLDIDAPVADAVAIQEDNDPELELLLLGADDWATIYATPSSICFYTLDLVEDLPVATSQWTIEDVTTTTYPPHLEPFDDLDGDGRDDVIFFVTSAQSEDTYTVAKALLSSRAWNPDEPGFGLSPLARHDGFLERLAGGPVGDAVADIDLDGKLDIVTAYTQSLDSSFVHIWYPSREPVPIDTGTTDTGQTTPTRPTADTGTTTDPDTTNPTPSTNEPKGCGCDQSGSPWAVLALLPLYTRRIRRRGLAPRHPSHHTRNTTLEY